MLGLGNILTKGGALLGFPNKYSFNFDGSNDYLDCGNSTGIQFSGSFSVSFWFNTTDATASNEILVSKSNDGVNHGWLIRLNSSRKLEFEVLLGVITDSGSASNDGNWHHVVAVHESGVGNRLYKNGSLVASNSTGTNLSNHVPNLHIGNQDHSTPRAINSLIDEVAVWSVALSADDVAKIYKKPVDFSKASTYATDRTANLKLWLRAGDKVLPEEDKSIARSDFYTDFDGTNDYVDCGDGSGLGFSGAEAFSLTAWVNPSSLSSAQIINAFGSDTSSSPEGKRTSLFINSSAKPGLAFWGNDVISDGTVSTNKWVHLVTTFAGGNRTSANTKIYIDGVSQTLTGGTASALDLSDMDFFHIGADQNESQVCNGIISNTSIYKTVLDAQTIKQFAKSRYTPMRDNRFSVVDFDDTNDRIDVSTTLSSSAYTVMGWVYKTRQDASYFADFRKDSGTGYFAFGNNSNNSIYAQSGTLYVNGVTGTTVPLNAWTHICVTGMTIESSTIKIACQNNDTNFFQGSYSSFSVYSGTKSAEEVYALYSKGITYNESAESSLLHYYRMGDDTSKAYPTIADSSSNSNDGTITNGASDDIVQQAIAMYDMGAFESTEELNGEVNTVANATSPTNETNSTTGWERSDTVNSTLEVVSNETYSGDYSLKFTATTSGDMLNTASTFTVKSGALYKVSITWKSEGTEVNGFSMGWGTTKDGGNYINQQVDESTDWVTTTNYIKTTTTTLGAFIHEGAGSSDTKTIYIDSVTIKEVLQSDLSDTYPAIIDVNEPVLGVDLITNGTFDSNITGWGKTHISSTPDVTYNNGKARIAYSSSGNTINIGINTTTNPFNGISGIVKVTGNIQIISGSIASSSSFKVYETNTANNVSVALDANGDFTAYIIVGSNQQLGIYASADVCTFEVDNITAKQVSGNVGTMTNQASSDLVYSSVLPDQSFLTGVNSAYNYIDLGGTDEYVSVDGIVSDMATQTGTINLWVKPSSDTGNTIVVFTYNDNNARSDMMFRYNFGASNRLEAGLAQGGTQKWETYTATNSATSHIGNWTMITLVHDGSAPICYINGVDAEWTVVNSSDKTFWLGDMSGVDKSSLGIWNYTSLSNAFIGEIGQSAVWNKNLSASEILAIYNLGRHGNLLDKYSDNLVGNWAMSALDASSGISDVGNGTIYDRSGNSNHGTATNTESADLASSPNAEPNGYSKGDTNRSNNTP